MDALMTTKEAARRLGVGPSTIKRWADEGRLEHVRTAGGHRRFPRTSVERLLQGLLQEAPVPAGEEDPLLVPLVDPRGSVTGVLSALLLARARAGAWWEVAEQVGPVLSAVGTGWAEGRLEVVTEHLASERLSRALAQVVEMLPVSPWAPRCLFMAAEGEEHTLGLSLAEVVAREAGWNTLWTGRRTPVEEVESLLAEGRVAMVGATASAWLPDPQALDALARRLGKAAAGGGGTVVLGGGGAWPESAPGVVRVRTFDAFRSTLAGAAG